MSEVMTPMSFEQLVDWVLQEKKKRGTVFGQHHAYRVLLFSTEGDTDPARYESIVWDGNER